MIRVKDGLYMIKNKNTPQDVRNQEEWNFSPFTGEKLNDVCLNCWVKKQSHNCGNQKCPGRKLLIEEIKALGT